jgi:hypothetical protein
VLPPFVVIPFGRAVGGALGSTALWPGRLPLWASTGAAVLVADLTSYWWHRLQHTTGESWPWRLHSVHHSPRHFDLWMGARVHPFDTLVFTIVAFGVLAALGAPTVPIEIAAFFAAMVGAVHHTSVDTDCTWLNRVVPFADHHVVPPLDPPARRGQLRQHHDGVRSALRDLPRTDASPMRAGRRLVARRPTTRRADMRSSSSARSVDSGGAPPGRRQRAWLSSRRAPVV